MKWGGAGRRSRLPADPRTYEIRTWAEIKTLMPNWLSHSDTLSLTLLERSIALHKSWGYYMPSIGEAHLGTCEIIALNALGKGLHPLVLASGIYNYYVCIYNIIN